jgi:hypothetical protein
MERLSGRRVVGTIVAAMCHRHSVVKEKQPILSLSARTAPSALSYQVGIRLSSWRQFPDAANSVAGSGSGGNSTNVPPSTIGFGFDSA